ncbi:PREDICTED: tRNA (guanine(37)-N1)-methyltransferase 1 [Lupinus angustifolius]|uniref:tRNA (guanine(37)-N1)-methyltransferase 1 n=1 Tax=Lupinus angustifolius TaxID=3871 RepID=UPI00092F330D|nr:PREDICTED: tRNA (guanine(37)-N1)-methyltransferase 1 [Lupinus angustifolius]
MLANQLFLKPHFPFPKLIPSTLTKKPFISLTTFSLTPTPHFSTSTTPLPYGPSLNKGTLPPHFPQQPLNDTVLNEESFTRIFNLSALRVPSSDCSSLESRLRGHLLNWPRIRNIARVPGDEIDPEIAPLIGKKDEEGVQNDVVSLQRRIHGEADSNGDVLSPVLYRERLAKTFNTRGFVKFRNLAKISRPNRTNKSKKDEKESGRDKKRIGKNGFAAVEVIDDDDDDDDENLGNLVEGEEGFRRKKWKGSTRLLLLDEQHSGRGVEELPEAVKAVLKEYAEKSITLTFELVRCRLTLFYDYWQMNEILEALLPEGVVVPSGFEIVGHIAHLNLRDEHLPHKKLIAKVVLDKNKPKIQTVANKIDSIHNKYRTMQLEVLAGNHSLVTTVIENGIRFQVDLATVYWNSRLATERQRLLSSFTRDDVVCDVFSGAGPLAISAARIVRRVFANDLNPYAVEYLERNIVLNKLDRKVKVFNMDGRRFIESMYASDKGHSITQVVMNLPNEAAEFLDAFRGIYKDKPRDEEHTLPMIHVYGFSKATDPEFDFHERIRIALLEVAVNVEMRRVRLVAPGKWMLCASFILPRSVAFAKTDNDN